MDSNETRKRIQIVLQEALLREFGVELSALNGSVSPAVQQLIEEIAAQVAEQQAQNNPAAASHENQTVPTATEEVHPRNRLNRLTGAQWLWFTKSILRTSYPSILGHDLRKKQGGNKPPQLMQDLISFFTRPGEVVLDPFAGAGGTALGAHLAGRESVNIEINPESYAIYLAVCQQEGLTPHPFHLGDCRDVLERFPSEKFDMIATDPPYSPELEQTMSGEKANALYGRANRKSSYITYSADSRDLSKSGSFDQFFDDMTEVGKSLLRVLKPRKYMAMILRDAYQDSQYIPTSAIIARRYTEIGWVLKGEKIWYQTGARIRPYGYPSAYIPNIVHQNILIFRKE